MKFFYDEKMVTTQHTHEAVFSSYLRGQLLASFMSKPLAAPPLSEEKMMTVLFSIPLLYNAFVKLPTESSKAASIASKNTEFTINLQIELKQKIKS